MSAFTSASSPEKDRIKAPCTMKSETHLIANDPRKSNRIMARIIPPILVLLVAFSCYVWYYVCYSWFIVNNHVVTGVCLIVFQVVLLLLLAASFFRILLTPAGYLPNRADIRAYNLDQADRKGVSSTEYDDPKTYDRSPNRREIEKFLAALPLSQASLYLARTDPSDYTRYCAICDVTKYDRVHHCSEVNRCVRKFDHYCPWVGGPLGHSRYKFFVQFITYVALYCILIMVTTSITVAQRHQAINRKAPGVHIPAYPGLWYALIALSAFFGAMMVPFSLFHIYQICVNQTTIESIQAHPIQIMVNSKRHAQLESGDIRQRITLDPSANPFNLGIWQNLQQVLGPVHLNRWALFSLASWFLPIHGSPGDGLYFPYSEELMKEADHQLEMAAQRVYV